MAFKIFKKEEEKAKKPQSKEIQVEASEPAVFLGSASVLKRFYVSEKASRLMAENKYMFEVAKGATKNEIKKQVEKRYHVHVTAVRVQNMPTKKRNVGRYAGLRSGFRKAIVSLKDGDSISQVKA
ncbi:MAG TPA: 50S ribosomal protein L23 [Candidatus Paceibacterota bacterium]|nr:50S ribosomal protein L23 [Candidatus Paceibacterota bacterium]